MQSGVWSLPMCQFRVFVWKVSKSNPKKVYDLAVECWLIFLTYSLFPAEDHWPIFRCFPTLPHCVQKNVFCVLLSLWFCGQWVMWSRVRFRQWRICLNLWFSMWWTIEISDIKQWKGEGHKQYESKESLTNYQWDNPVYTSPAAFSEDYPTLYNYHIRWPYNYKYWLSGRWNIILGQVFFD